jgi:hypothetical protein
VMITSVPLATSASRALSRFLASRVETCVCGFLAIWPHG